MKSVFVNFKVLATNFSKKCFIRFLENLNRYFIPNLDIYISNYIFLDVCSAKGKREKFVTGLPCSIPMSGGSLLESICKYLW